MRPAASVGAHDTVNATINHANHFGVIIDRPHVHRHVGGMGRLDELHRNNINVAKCRGNLERHDWWHTRSDPSISDTQNATISFVRPT